MQDGKQLKYGQIQGGDVSFDHILTTGQAVYNASGRFVKRAGNGTDTVSLAGDGDTELLGHMECEQVASSAAGKVVKVNQALDAEYRIPINSGTYTHLMKGKTCDLSISTYQGAQLDASSEDTLIIVNGDLVNNAWVDVRLNPLKMFVIGCTTTT